MVEALNPRLSDARRRVILSKETSRQNKIWLVTCWRYFDGAVIEWKWRGEYMRSRMCFQFGPDEAFIEAKSYDEDVVPNLKFGKETANK